MSGCYLHTRCELHTRCVEACVMACASRDEVMFMCALVYDVALCGNTVRNVALGLWLVGYPCKPSEVLEKLKQISALHADSESDGGAAVSRQNASKSKVIFYDFVGTYLNNTSCRSDCSCGYLEEIHRNLSENDFKCGLVNCLWHPRELLRRSWSHEYSKHAEINFVSKGFLKPRVASTFFLHGTRL